jgi:hypothetical protein
MRCHHEERRKRMGTDEFNKYCPTCRRVKARAKFHRNRNTSDGLGTECADCFNKKWRLYSQRRKCTHQGTALK